MSPRGDKPTTMAAAKAMGWIHAGTLSRLLDAETYDRWHQESLMLDGMRMGPPLHHVASVREGECPGCGHLLRLDAGQTSGFYRDTYLACEHCGYGKPKTEKGLAVDMLSTPVRIEPTDGVSVQPTWMRSLPLQQQSVILLAGRGPDGMGKKHPCKPVVRAYRGTIFVAGKYGRLLEWGEKADSFMSLNRFADRGLWDEDLEAFFNCSDELPLHYVTHLMHGAQIVGFKHPDVRFRDRWSEFYQLAVTAFHLNPETEEQMDQRLSDWNREHWQK